MVRVSLHEPIEADQRKRIRVFSERLKIARRKAGLSQMDLARKIGRCRATVAAWESGNHHEAPNALDMTSLTLCLACNGYWLLGFTDRPQLASILSTPEAELVAIFREMSLEAGLELLEFVRDHAVMLRQTQRAMAGGGIKK